MIYTSLIQKAIKFSIQVHELDQQQKRKGKDIPYITHPLSVGLILALSGASEELVAAGILHDTIEDSLAEKKVTEEMLTERFGKNIAALVASVSEFHKDQSWEVRKQEALDHIRLFSHESLLLKSADILSNASELLDDYEQIGDLVFDRFNAPKEKILKNYLVTITAIVECWPESPLAKDLIIVSRQLQMLGAIDFMMSFPSIKIEYSDYDENILLECPICLWKGTSKESGMIGYYDDLFDVSCPNCDKMILVVSYPLGR